jgi:predicted lipid-binding transport protein (Tim44 family)
MNTNFEYIDIIILAMIAGFVLLRLKNVLGRKTGHQDKPVSDKDFSYQPSAMQSAFGKEEKKGELDQESKTHFLKGAKIAYEKIITAFAKGDKKSLKPLLNREMFDKFSNVIEERNKKKMKSETTFIGVKSANIKKFEKENSVYKITVGFSSELITCVRDTENKIVEGNPDVIKTANDVWKFAKNMWSEDPTWYLVETLK